MEITPDLFNGMFEIVSAILMLINVSKLYEHKTVKGVSLIPPTFFTLWGFWNLYYYSNLEQWFSLYGAIALVVVNTIWLTMAVHYTKETK